MAHLTKTFTLLTLVALYFIASVSSSPLNSLSATFDDSSLERRAQKEVKPKFKTLPADKKNVKFTYYWVSFEDDFKSQTKNRVTLETCDKQILGRVDPKFAEALRTEGTGVAKDGSMFNLGDCTCDKGFSCFMKLPRELFKFGITASGVGLKPYVSIAANDIELGTKVFIPQLKGMKLPLDQVHNGCAIVEDTGHGFGGNHADFFVFDEKNYDFMIKERAFTKVDLIRVKDCEIIEYKV